MEWYVDAHTLGGCHQTRLGGRCWARLGGGRRRNHHWMRPESTIVTFGRG